MTTQVRWEARQMKLFAQQAKERVGARVWDSNFLSDEQKRGLVAREILSVLLSNDRVDEKDSVFAGIAELIRGTMKEAGL